MRQSTATPLGLAPARQLAKFLARFDPQVSGTVRAARAKLRQLLPGAVELVYDNYNALAIGFGPTERASDAFVSLAVYPRWVLLYFIHGAALPDPRRLLRGGGNQGRHIRLSQGTARELDDPAVRALIAAAIARGRVPLRGSGRQCILIKSVSLRQRDRRPAAHKSQQAPHAKQGK